MLSVFGIHISFKQWKERDAGARALWIRGLRVMHLLTNIKKKKDVRPSVIDFHTGTREVLLALQELWGYLSNLK